MINDEGKMWGSWGSRVGHCSCLTRRPCSLLYERHISDAALFVECEGCLLDRDAQLKSSRARSVVRMSVSNGGLSQPPRPTARRPRVCFIACR